MPVAAEVEAEAKTIAAWNEYLATLRDCHPYQYFEVEEWAWSRLQQTLRSLDLQRR